MTRYTINNEKSKQSKHNSQNFLAHATILIVTVLLGCLLAIIGVVLGSLVFILFIGGLGFANVGFYALQTLLVLVFFVGLVYIGGKNLEQLTKLINSKEIVSNGVKRG